MDEARAPFLFVCIRVHSWPHWFCSGSVVSGSAAQSGVYSAKGKSWLCFSGYGFAARLLQEKVLRFRQIL